VKPDRTVLFLLGACLILILSLYLPLVSVHKYCENRAVAAVFALISLVLLSWSFWNRTVSVLRKALLIIGVAFCFVAFSVNVAFILYATHLCRHMFDKLRPD